MGPLRESEVVRTTEGRAAIQCHPYVARDVIVTSV